MIVFWSSSFFGEIRFLIRSPTKNPLTFGRTCPHFEKSRAKIPLVMGGPRTVYFLVHALISKLLFVEPSFQVTQPFPVNHLETLRQYVW